jgi:hypothetical protein
MSNNLEFAIIGYQRTGTGVLTSMLNSSDDIYAAAEIFHPEAVGIESFARFYANNRSDMLSDRAYKYGQYIDMLRTETGKPKIGVNIKYGSCHHLDGDWKALSGPPKLFEVLSSRGSRIIHTVRRNLFRAAISNVMASSTGIWHMDLASIRLKDAIAADPDLIVQIMRLYERELTMFNQYTSDYPQIMTIEYEELFREGMFSHEVLNDVAEFLEVRGRFDHVPRIQKIMPENWTDAFLNSAAIEQAVSDAGYDHMLR